LIQTFGCQMNVHDSDKVANLLHHCGWDRAGSLDDADLLIINTCSIRDKAEQRLYSELGTLREWKSGAPRRVLAVAGCVAQQEGDTLLKRFAHVDFVYGTHNLRSVPTLVDAALAGSREAMTRESSSLDRFDLPAPHERFERDPAGRAFVTVMEGCDMFCSFCVVPFTRGREISRPFEGIVAEVRDLAERGVREITLLGQTVNAYGRHDRRREAARGSLLESVHPAPGFADLLQALSEIPGIRRLRYTSPHPTFFDADLVRAHGEIPELCPHVHLPVQSGSDRILERMRRRHTADDYRELVDRLRGQRSDLALTTDVIVGFPGETDADFRATLDLVRDVEFVDSFSFKYSPRPSTAAAELRDPVEPSLAQERLEELQTLQRSLTLAANRARVGTVTEVLVEGPSRRGGNQVRGRDPFHRTVNFPARADGEPAAGSLVDVVVVDASPHTLIGEWPDARPSPTPSAPPATELLKVVAGYADEDERCGASGE